MSPLFRHIHPSSSVLLKALGITILAFALSMVLMQPFSFSAATLISSHDRTDFNMTDFYNIVADSRNVRSLDRDIVIVDIADTDREDVTDLLEAIPDFEPAAVGLDVSFMHEREGDWRLLEAIRRCPNLVMVADIDLDGTAPVPEQQLFRISDTSYFYDSISYLPHGAPNLIMKFAGSTVRHFRTSYPLGNGDSIDSFPVAITRLYNPEAVGRMERRGNSQELICYPSRTFRVIKWDDIARHADDLRGRIVMIGDMDTPDDHHRTPLAPDTPGIEIHCYALSTILNGLYFSVATPTTNNLLALTLCFLMILISFEIPGKAKGLILRFVQVAILYLLIRVGYWLFIDHNLIVDLSMSLLMLTFGFFALDIWTGVSATIELISEKLRKYKQQSYETTS